MAFRIEIEPQAFEDLDSLAERIRIGGSFQTAEKWFNGIIDAIATLSEMPARCGIAPEARALEQDVRLLLYGRRNRKYKIYFAIVHETQSTGVVRILHVRHWARKPLTNEELQELKDDEN